jgi:hypothetical protein
VHESYFQCQTGSVVNLILMFLSLLKSLESPLRVNGKLKGVFNGVAIDDSDLFSYIVPQDGRAYTAIAKIPERLGYDLQTVITLGTSIGWLFSTSARGAPNGFTFTGKNVVNFEKN